MGGIMGKEVWKSFEENQLTHSAAHYLMTIHELLSSQGYARVTDIAKRLSITRGSCSISLKPLKKRGLVVEDANRFLALSPEGRRLAEIVEKNDELLRKFLHELLGVSPDQAEVDACKIEHLLSLESSVKLARFIDFLEAGGTAAEDFLRRARTWIESCDGDAAGCAICQDECFYEHEKSARHGGAAPEAARPSPRFPGRRGAARPPR
jgi:DtxR family transcriptional regulator, Mn-dependent transcriptional regulator